MFVEAITVPEMKHAVWVSVFRDLLKLLKRVVCYVALHAVSARTLVVTEDTNSDIIESLIRRVVQEFHSKKPAKRI